MGVELTEEDNQMKMRFLVMLMVASKLLWKSIYTSWLCYFVKEECSLFECVVEAFLAYRLLWYVLPSGPENGPSQSVLKIAKGTKFALAPLREDGWMCVEHQKINQRIRHREPC